MGLKLSNIEQVVKLGDCDKRPFVFLHGNSQNRSCGYGVLKFFESIGHSTYCYDLPGHGNSPMPDHDYQFTDLIDLNLAFLKKHKLQNPILCGHSLGGMIQAGSIERANLNSASLILCGSYDANPAIYNKKYFSQSIATEYDQALNEYIVAAFSLFQNQRFFDYFDNRDLTDEAVSLVNRQCNHPLASQYSLTTLSDFDCRESLMLMKTPILALHGEKEEVIHPELVRQMIIENPAAEVEWYPDGGHNAYYQQHELTNHYLEKHYQALAN